MNNEELEQLRKSIMILADAIEDGSRQGVRKEVREILYPFLSNKNKKK